MLQDQVHEMMFILGNAVCPACDLQERRCSNGNMNTTEIAAKEIRWESSLSPHPHMQETLSPWP